MSRDFEFKQLLRAYRSGIISQATFEGEMTCLEEGMPTANNGNGSSGGFKAFGRTYKSERDAVVSFLDEGASLHDRLHPHRDQDRCRARGLSFARFRAAPFRTRR